MYTRDNQDKSIELRAQGWSLRHIATEIRVSKRTLVDWNREFASDIQSLRKPMLPTPVLSRENNEPTHVGCYELDQAELASRVGQPKA